jgi:capsule polysaccharide export protein KpsE/RkpR
MDRHLLTVQKMSEKNHRDAVKYRKLAEEHKKTMASKFAEYEALLNAEREAQQALRNELTSLKVGMLTASWQLKIILIIVSWFELNAALKSA